MDEKAAQRRSTSVSYRHAGVLFPEDMVPQKLAIWVSKSACSILIKMSRTLPARHLTESPACIPASRASASSDIPEVGRADSFRGLARRHSVADYRDPRVPVNVNCWRPKKGEGRQPAITLEREKHMLPSPRPGRRTA
jgi:hypothetical protein